MLLLSVFCYALAFSTGQTAFNYGSFKYPSYNGQNVGYSGYQVVADNSLQDSGSLSYPSSNERTVGHGLQVVKVISEINKTTEYELDLNALQQLLGREDVADYPVAVVSIAGAFRGGKSFLLDFFLRYLKAPRWKQQSGEWLGDENEPLQGFPWRGGSERETTGIYLWSEPFHIKLEPNGEEVVVLLMDTQGTFDDKSTNRDSTIIFAMSTLLSSVQLYNLFRNINENDLQNLHLFTEYGQKANAGGKAFQELQFLIRDWPNVDEHDYGYNGGNTFLAKRLNVTPNQNPEVREVREHIRNCFEKVTCFLMPHPGLKVARKFFNGSLADIEEDFKSSLLELVPSLFSPMHLTPKMVGGQKVTARDLILYFQQYVKVFNSDTLPPVTNILSGTAAAAILAATNAARQKYDERMKVLDDKNQSFTSATIVAKHNAARDAAIQLFTARVMIGDKEDSDRALNQLTDDLGQFLRSYQYNNDIKVRHGLQAAKHVYNETLCSASGVQYKQQLCLHPADLEQIHQDALDAALAKFSSLRELENNEADDEKKLLKEGLVAEYSSVLRSLNAINNKKAVQQAQTLYLTTMNAQKSKVDQAQLRALHNDTIKLAKQSFATMRNKPTKHTEDPYEKDLIQKMEADYIEFENKNINTNRIAIHLAQQVYNDHVSSEWSPDDACFHPQALETLHKKAKEQAIQEFQNNGVEFQKDMFMEELNSALQNRYDELTETNDYNNNQAVESAFQEYVSDMDRFKAPINFIEDFFKNFSLSSEHSARKADAEESFRKKRRGRKDYSYDKYMNRLEDKINAMYSSYATFWSDLVDKIAAFFKGIFG